MVEKMKREIWIGSLVLKYFGTVITFVALFSSCTKDENILTQPPAAKWKTIFFDDFNRANTVNEDLGSNWTVFNATGGSIMQIINNEVHAVEVRALYEPEKCPYALYTQDLNYTCMRISVKMRTDSIANAITILFVTADTLLSEGYFMGYDGSLFMHGNGVISYTWLGDLSANTTYMLEIITDSTGGFGATMIDSATGYRIIYGGVDGSLVSGIVGFMAGARSPSAVYVDDFKIEIPE